MFFSTQEDSWSNNFGSSNSSRYLRGRQGESLVADLFSLLRSFVPLGAGFVLSVSKRYTHGQRVQREHTVRVGRRNRES